MALAGRGKSKNCRQSKDDGMAIEAKAGTRP